MFSSLLAHLLLALIFKCLSIPSQQPGGGLIAEGLASDGRFLYFTRNGPHCSNGSIARVRLDGHGLRTNYIVLPGRHCPQDLAYANGFLYWTEIGQGGRGFIGRASVDGANVRAAWLTLSVGTSGGPWDVTADARDVFWTWGGNGGPIVIGRASTSGRLLDARFLTTRGGDELALSS